MISKEQLTRLKFIIGNDVEATEIVRRLLVHSNKYEALKGEIEFFCGTVDRAVKHLINRNKGGMQVPYFDDFANIVPSTAKELERFVKRFKGVINDLEA